MLIFTRAWAVDQPFNDWRGFWKSRRLDVDNTQMDGRSSMPHEHDVIDDQSLI